MKYIISLLASAFIFISPTISQDAISTHFGKYLDHQDFTSVYISPKLFKMVSKMDIADMDPEVQEVISELDGLRILTSEKNTKSLYGEISQVLLSKNFETLMTVKDNGEDVKFLIKESNDKISELLLLVNGTKEFVLMDFVGDIDLAKISKLAKSMDLQGIEHLDKIKKKQ